MAEKRRVSEDKPDDFNAPFVQVDLREYEWLHDRIRDLKDDIEKHKQANIEATKAIVELNKKIKFLKENKK